MRRTVTAAQFLAIALLLACAGRTPSSAVTSFYQAVEDGDTKTATSLLTVETVAMLGEEKMKAGLQKAGLEMQEKGGLAGIEITQETVSGEVAKVTAVLTYGNGTTETEVHELRKQDGRWRIEPSK